MNMDAFEGGVDLEGIDETRGMGRRTFLMGALAVGAAASTPFNYAAAARKRRVPLAGEASFDVGVASGFPRPKAISLWTRLGGIKRTSKLKLIVATDRKFKNVVEEKLVTARKDRDFTVHTTVRKLKPDKQYFYKFATKENGSPVGRFTTAPPADSERPIRIAFYSCQNWESGFFNAQRAIANEPDLDLVICLGDYIYEYSDIDATCGCGAVVRIDRTGGNNDGDVQLLPEYWEKYRLYKGDPDLRAMHAAHPFIAVWDDHEVEDNHADGQPSSAQNDPNKTNLKDLPRKVPFLTRRENGYQAFFNYMPRLRFKGDRNRIYEHYRLGSLIDLLLTDERQYRDRQACEDAILTPCPDSDTPRTMLGEAQKNWFLRTLKSSPQTWKVWGTQLMVMATRLAPSVAAQQDAWDGYSYERKLILDYIVDQQIPNVVAITGDIHTFFAGTAYTTGDKVGVNAGRPAVPEFVGGSATSLGLPEATGLSDEVLAGLAAVNPHITYYDFRRRGYGLLEVTPTEATCELKTVNALAPGASGTSTLAKFSVPLNSREAQRIA